MALRSSTALAIIALFTLGSGCKPPPPPPQPEATAEQAPPPPPPPPPKCEALSEKCEAKADTTAKIPNAAVTFTPAAGWVYAQLSSATIAQSGEQGPGIAFLGFEFDPKKEAASREATLAEVAKQLGLAPLKQKVPWKTPDDTRKIDGFSFTLYQLKEPGLRGAKKGSLIVAAGTVGEHKGVVGIGFLPDDDTNHSEDAIMKAIESIRKAP